MRIAVILGIVWLACGEHALGQGSETAESSGRLRFDAEQGQWTPIPSEEPGTPAGDLQLIRRLHTDGTYDKALKAAKEWEANYGQDHALYPEVALLTARSLIGHRDYEKAHDQLADLLAGYAGGAVVDEALELEFVVAEVFLSGTKRKFLGMRMLDGEELGIQILDDITNNYAGTRIAELAHLAKAGYYSRKGDYLLAETEYEMLIQQYPRSGYRRKAMLQSAKSALAGFPGIKYDEAPLIEAEERLRQYLTLFPGSAEQEGVGTLLTDIAETRAAKEYEMGTYYERVGELQAAIFYYRSTVANWPDSIAAIRAADRLDILGHPVATQTPQDESADAPTAAARQPTESDEPQHSAQAAPAQQVEVDSDDASTEDELIIDLDAP